MSVLQHNKKREELHRLKEKYPEVAARLDAKGVSALEDSDVSSSEEEVSKHPTLNVWTTYLYSVMYYYRKEGKLILLI